MIQNIFILWASGSVGRELISQIIEHDGAENNVNPSRIVWLANTKHFIFDPSWIDTKLLQKISSSRDSAIQELHFMGSEISKMKDLLASVKKYKMDGEVVFADVTAGKDELLDFHNDVLNKSKNFLVTANKNPISLYSVDDFKKLNAEYGRYDTNTTVMWWAGILNFVKERVSIHDAIKKIEWVFSGTLWYILSELEKQEKTFSQIVKDAKEGWYTEPNPMDDLNGLDVARKLVILAREAWHSVDINDVEVNPLIDEKYSKYKWDDFLKAIQDEDVAFSSKVKNSEKKWEVLRYVWEMIVENGKLMLRVWLKSVPKNSDLWTLSGTSNLALVETDILWSPLPHVIKSRGAGLAVTAWAVRVWIAKMLPPWISKI